MEEQMIKKLLLGLGLLLLVGCLSAHTSRVTPQLFTYNAPQERVWHALISFYSDVHMGIADQHNTTWTVVSKDVITAADPDVVNCTPNLPNIEVAYTLRAFLTAKGDSTTLHLLLSVHGNTRDGRVVLCQSTGATERLVAAGVNAWLHPDEE